ncbi:hypothetical protein E4T56_gene9883 [Termitomyces sp. T112]|nr:hypothetical protein E4T56_gene9883 [Termitomyces sp. T112]
MDSKHFSTPYYMLISGLSLTQAEYLTGLEVISTKEVTIFLKCFGEQRPTFVLTIYGLTFNDSEEACSAVTDLVKSCLNDSEAIQKHIAECAPMLKEETATTPALNTSNGDNGGGPPCKQAPEMGGDDTEASKRTCPTPQVFELQDGGIDHNNGTLSTDPNIFDLEDGRDHDNHLCV